MSAAYILFAEKKLIVISWLCTREEKEVGHSELIESSKRSGTDFGSRPRSEAQIAIRTILQKHCADDFN